MLLRLNIAACLLKIKEANQALKECEAVSEQEGKIMICSDESLFHIVTFLMAIEFCMFKTFFYKLFYYFLFFP